MTPRVQVFFSQQHVAEAVWIPQWQQHANGAKDVAAVTILSEQPECDFGEFFHKVCGEGRVSFTDGNIVANTPNGQINVLTVASFENRYGEAVIEIETVFPYVVATTIRVEAIGRVAGILKSNGVPFQTMESGSVLVAPGDGVGVMIEFIE